MPRQKQQQFGRFIWTKQKSLIVSIVQFVEWVRDSILRLKLAEMADLEGKTPGNGDIGEFAYLDSMKKT
jgi:hypothetical protein